MEQEIRDRFGSVVCAIRRQGADYGRSDQGGGRSIQVEFVSADPNGPLHVGHGRAAALGDAVARLLEWTGWRVSREYYINDTTNGTQMVNFGRSLLVRYQQALGGDWLFPSTRSGKPWGKVAQYESARRVLADAGLDADGGGSFRLRHTFALRQLATGIDADRLARWLGVVDPTVIQRYLQALPERGLGSPAQANQEPGQAAQSIWVLPV